MSSVMAQRLHDYLTMRRGLGFKLVRDGEVLADFVAYLDRAGATKITTELALAYATAPAGADPSWWGNRLRAVRGFARYLANLDPGTQIPPTHLLPSAPHRAVPYIYSVAEIAALLEAAATIHTRRLALTYQTLVGLLAVTGLRISEAINLDRADVDLDEGLLVVRNSKFGNSRELPLHPTTVTALRDYDQTREPNPPTAAWFVSSTGQRLTCKAAEWHFRRLTRSAGLSPRSEKCRPRLHDLRHTFAVNTLLGWYRDGVDVQARLPLLSTFLGHVHPANTYWYLSATPQLMHLVAQRLEPIGPVR